MLDTIREHAATHYCLISLNLGEVDLDDEFIVEATAGAHMNYETSVEDFLTKALLPFASAASQAAELEWEKAWEESGADSGYAEYVPTPAEKFNWQDVETMAHNLGVDSQIVLNFLCNTLPHINLHDFEVEWEDESDEHCRTFLLVSPE